MIDNNPTYSFAEVIHLILTLDENGLIELGKLLKEERKRYCLRDAESISKVICLRYKYPEVMKEVKGYERL